MDTVSQQGLSHKERRENHLKCKICARESNDKSVYCLNHNQAYLNLEEGFQKWRRALGVNWLEYLEKIKGNRSTGAWVCEVVVDILGNV